MDQEKKDLLRERKQLALDSLDHAKTALQTGMVDTRIAIESIERAARQIQHWPTE